MVNCFQKMNFPQNLVTVKTFNVVPGENEHEDRYGLLTWTCQGGSIVNIGCFDLTTGYKQKEVALELVSISTTIRVGP